VSGVDRRSGRSGRWGRGDRALSIRRCVESARRVRERERTTLRLRGLFGRLWEFLGDGERLRGRLADGVVSRWMWCRCGCEALSGPASLRAPRWRPSLESARLRRRVRSLLPSLSRERTLACLAGGCVSVSWVRRLEESLAARGAGDDGLSLLRSRGRSRAVSRSLVGGSSGLHWSISAARREPAM